MLKRGDNAVQYKILNSKTPA